MFIVVEGCDYAGKTKLVKELCGEFIAEPLQEPGSSPLAMDVRKAMKTHRMDKHARQLLMHGCRLDMLANHDVEDPDKLYIIDRYVLSTVIYANSDGIMPNTIMRLLNLFSVPDPVMTLIISPQWTTILGRMRSRDGLDALEGSVERLEKVYHGYLAYAGLVANPYYFILDNHDTSYLQQAINIIECYPDLTQFRY